VLVANNKLIKRANDDYITCTTGFKTCVGIGSSGHDLDVQFFTNSITSNGVNGSNNEYANSVSKQSQVEPVQNAPAHPQQI
jgi:hypothetical protein